MFAAGEVAFQDLAIHDELDMVGNCTAMTVGDTNQGECATNSSNGNDHYSVCAICLNKIVLQQTALVKGCEHAYCVTCILRWASCKKEPTCPQCKQPFEFLNIHQALDGSIHDYMFEESVCLLLRASWFKPLVEVVKEESEIVEECYYDYEEEDYPDEFYLGRSSSLCIGNRRWGDNGYVRGGRQEARPRPNSSSIPDAGAGPSHQPKKKNTPAKEITGRRAKRALKREAAAAKHQQRMNMEEPLNEAGRFIYNPESGDEASYSGILEIHVHHARNIHNICIYEKQDVYAKFSLTYNPDDTVATRVVSGGGKNPDFNDDLMVKINAPDAVLKCEIWMMSRAKNFMDDQLLGFVLVPVSSISGKGRLTQDFHLSSTDLFHSPAGTIKLSLFLNAKAPTNPIPTPASASFADPLLLDKEISDDYCRLEFPDINVVDQNQRMVSEYFAENAAPLKPWPEKPDGSFLHLGAAPPTVEDYEMAAANSSDECAAGSVYSTMTSLSDDRNSADSMEKKGLVFGDFSNDNASSSSKPCTEASTKSKECVEENEDKEAEMQQQIVEMYMRSMQQFTESLAKMKLPMGGGAELEGDVIQSNSDEKMEEMKKKKDSCRVFYGSRAFF